MENEDEKKRIEVTNVNADDTSIDYISAINEIKANSVDKAAYDKLKQENKQLIDALVNGGQVDVSAQSQPIDIEQLRKELFSPNSQELSNLDYITKALQLRNALIENGEKDPFLPYGKNIMPDEDDMKKANQAAEVLQECVDIAKGNNDAFTTELQRRMIDPPTIIKNIRR